MYLTSALLVLLQSGLSAAAPRISSALRTRDTFAPPAVVSTSFSGSGCPQGTTGASTAGVWENFSFDLPSFKVKTGPSSDITERSVNCQAHLNFGGPTTGWQFALKNHWSTGHFETDGTGVTLTQYLTVYFSQDAANTATTVQSIPSTDNSNVSKDLNLHTSIPEVALIWSPCKASGILNVNFRMAFSGATSNVTAYYGASSNSSVSEQWDWAWRRC
ncbi:hypothetical protein E0Z10_g5666 [Xylaria hypoxylon]|uniref:Ubiquitin 3 binding protein But2 C-terminal domain-containing protein n=1 Tax=Xylaria hypoxylon TaxID=37992 RepID=A0A4Z0YUN3_9PEZI|nr:hypothetical protein E0Z10_g5666 [Xylaria hypoxylon]